MSRVYVVQQHMRKDKETNQLRSHDYSTAEKFGAVIFLVPWRSVVESEWGGDVERLLADKLKDFTPDDYLLPSGDSILCAQTVLAIAAVLPPDARLKMLKWNKRAVTYDEITIKIPF